MTVAPDRGPRWLEYVPLDELRPDPRNPKNHRLDTLRESVVRWGYSEPVQVDERTGLIVSGHGRRELLLDDRATGRPAPEGVVVDGDGGWLVPVVRGWASTDDDEAFGYLVAANRIGEQGGWLTERLLAGLEPLAAKGPDMLAGVGYTPDDLSGLLALLQSEAPPVVSATDPDEVPEPPPEPVSRRGDLWLCGPHRVLCGDATVLADVERVMVGAKADMVWTDPPYGIDYVTVRDGTSKIANDADLIEAEGVMRAALSNVGVTLGFVCCGWRSLPITLQAMTDAGMDPKACIVWDKGVRVQNLDRFAKQHEFMLYAGPFGGQPTVDVDVWAIARDYDPDHPTPKPVALIERSVVPCSRTGAVVVDPFGGSGSTLIACHSTGRKARLIEKDEHYTDVICRRYQEFTGDVPVLESTGEPHDFCAQPEPAVSDR